MKEGYNHYDSYGSVHLTVCFNILILLQISNMLNCKELKSRWSCIIAFKEKPFAVAWIISIVIQWVALRFGARVLRIAYRVPILFYLLRSRGFLS